MSVGGTTETAVPVTKSTAGTLQVTPSTLQGAKILRALDPVMKRRNSTFQRFGGRGEASELSQPLDVCVYVLPHYKRYKDIAAVYY